MKARLSAAAVSLVAIIATMVGYVHEPSTAAPRSSLLDLDFARRSVAGQLPEGFTLPSSDVDLAVSSLVASDLDADGDLDIVAADRSGNAIGIVVWVNDGAGRLTRKAPAPSNSLASEPASPSLHQREGTVVVSVQPHSPAIEGISVNAWLTLPARRHSLALAVAPASVTRASRRPRSPPVLS